MVSSDWLSIVWCCTHSPHIIIYLEDLDLKTDCSAPPISDVSDNKRFLHSMIIVLLLTHDFITIILMTWTAGSSLLNSRIEQSDWRRWNWMLTWLGLISIDDQWQSEVLISGIYILFHPSPSREPPWVLLFCVDQCWDVRWPWYISWPVSPVSRCQWWQYTCHLPTLSSTLVFNSPDLRSWDCCCWQIF